MSILSLLLGIIAIVAALMPGCHYIFLVVCCIGLASGLIALHEHKTDPGVSIFAIVLNSYATILILMWSLTIAIGTINATENTIESDDDFFNSALIPALLMQKPTIMPNGQTPAALPQKTTTTVVHHLVPMNKPQKNSEKK